jgi:hypothetical protein
MTHRAETIVATVTTKVTGLATTGARVFRGREYPLEAAGLPGLLVYLGPDEPVAEYSQTLIDSLLTIHILGVVKSITEQVDTTLNRIREEVAVALQADYTQGLSFVLDTREGESEEPDISNEGEQPAASLRLTWRFLYRRSRLNPGA